MKRKTVNGIRIRDGCVKMTEEYKYLGNWLNEKWNEEIQIKEIRDKRDVRAMKNEVKRIIMCGMDVYIGQINVTLFTDFSHNLLQ